MKSGDSKVKSVLGINWDLTSVVFIFDFKDIIEMGQSIKMTKRNILRVSSSFCDPLGLIPPISVNPNIFYSCFIRKSWIGIL